jgi:CPA1 family monovalent cation:H+ antiporter
VHAIDTVVALLIIVAVLVMLARRWGVPYPIVLVLGGLLLGFVPGLPAVRLDPETVFVLFLPPILYSAAVFTSFRQFRANLRPISLLAVGLVLTTTIAIAVVAHAAIDGLTWPAAFALGAIVSPPDAVAATAITRKLGIPQRIVTILEERASSTMRVPSSPTGWPSRRLSRASSISGAALQFVLASVGGVLVGLGRRVGRRARAAAGGRTRPSRSSSRFSRRSRPTCRPRRSASRASWPSSRPVCSSADTAFNSLQARGSKLSRYGRSSSFC